MAIQKTEALVISRRDFRETSLIVNFFTKDFGKISGLLKGIRTEPQKFASTLEPFSYNDIIFYQKLNSELHLISACDIKENFDAIRNSINRVGLASVMLELLDCLMQPEDSHTDVFDLALATVRELAVNYNPDKIITIFKIKLLALSGFKPHFNSCVACNDKISGQSKFSLIRGGLLCPGCFGKDTSARTIFRGTVASIVHIERNDLKNNLNLGLNPQIKRELEAILNAFLNFHLGKELKSQRVLNKLAVGV